jgi:hypothetical protein
MVAVMLLADQTLPEQILVELGALEAQEAPTAERAAEPPEVQVGALASS